MAVASWDNPLMVFVKHAVVHDHTADQYAAPSWFNMPGPPDWTKQAPCWKPGIREIFWLAEDELENGGSIRTDPGNPVVRAQKVCASCPLSELCLSEALADEKKREGHERQCIRGGRTPADRERISKGLPLRKARPKKPKPIPKRDRTPEWVPEAARLRKEGLSYQAVADEVGHVRSYVTTQLRRLDL